MGQKHETLFGLGLANGVGQTSELLAQARIADEGGLDFVGVFDHPSFADALDAYALLGFVLGATDNVAGAVICTNLLARPAPVLARTVTSLSVISGRRIILPLGSSGLETESVALGLPGWTAGQRIRALEEAIQIIRALCGGGDPVTFEGDFYKVDELAPATIEAPPIWTGVGGPKGLAVAGRQADGWIPPHGADWHSTLVAEKRPLIDEAAAAAGRDPADIGNIFMVTGSITEDPQTTTRNEQGRWNGGGVQQWVEELTFAALERQAIAINYVVGPGQVADDTTLNRWAHEVVPAVRAAIAKG